MSDSRTADEAAIESVLVDAYKAWAANDADAFVENYTEDCVSVLPGVLRQGRETIRKGMAMGFQGPLKGSSTYNKQISIRFLGNDGAVVLSESGVMMAGETEVPDARKVNATWVMEKRDGHWLIASYHNCAMLPPAAPSAH